MIKFNLVVSSDIANLLGYVIYLIASFPDPNFYICHQMSCHHTYRSPYVSVTKSFCNHLSYVTKCSCHHIFVTKCPVTK